MTTDEDYVKQLEETIGKFLKPIEGIPFHIAIKALYGHQVIPLDLNAKRKLENFVFYIQIHKDSMNGRVFSRIV